MRLNQMLLVFSFKLWLTFSIYDNKPLNNNVHIDMIGHDFVLYLIQQNIFKQDEFHIPTTYLLLTVSPLYLLCAYHLVWVAFIG